ncbi:unnamed protein product, partial [Mesorhabditis spiculigera]
MTSTDTKKHWLPFNVFLNCRYRRNENYYRPLTPRERVEIVTLLMNATMRCKLTHTNVVSPRILWDTCPVDVVAHTSSTFLQGPKRTMPMPGSMGVPLDVYYQLYHDYNTTCAYEPVIRAGGISYPQDTIEICID